MRYDLASDPIWVLGLSIDDRVCWGVTQVVPGTTVYGREAFPRLNFPHGVICELDNIKSTDIRKDGSVKTDPIDLFKAIDSVFSKLFYDEAMRKILFNVKSIGISTVGVVNHSKSLLIDIKRKNISDYGSKKRDYKIDFIKLISDVFKRHRSIWNENQIISVRNDATAKSMAHYRFQSQLRDLESLCFINLSVGVNIGVVNSFGPLSSPNFHPELGHARPIKHEKDKDYTNYDGCIVHGDCFESLLSSDRMINEFGFDLRYIPKTEIIWDKISYYAAQLAWASFLSTAPDIIYLGGRTSCEALFERVKKDIFDLNAGFKLATTYLRYSDEQIQLAPSFPLVTDGSIREMDGIMGALELARTAL